MKETKISNTTKPIFDFLFARIEEEDKKISNRRTNKDVH